ncbi:hypothetical protein LTR49_028196 [Elasticomyces elasticus]|nr:hypothetical protein LTR49_028196 [Elasticomyces elasticus]
MVASCEEKLKDKSIVDGSCAECCQASSRVKLRQAIDPFMNAKANGTEPSLWPLVKQVCIGVVGSRVLDKVTIVDLPGISDTNETRIKVVRDFIKTCDHLWVVSPVGRIVDDLLTNEMISRNGKIFKGRVAIIATKSDTDIDPNLAEELQNEGHDLQEWFKLTDAIKAQNSKLKTLRAELLQERKRFKKPTKPKLMEMQGRNDTINELKRESKAMEMRRFEVLVHARNEFVTAQLRLHMGNYLPAGMKLPVFCISNRHYTAIKGGRTVGGLRLIAEATGVPALRAHALALPAADQFRTLEEYYSTDLGVFLKEAQLWVKVTQLERRAELLGLVGQPLYKLKERISTRLDAFEEMVKNFLIASLSEQFHQSRDTAVKVLDAKRKKHSATIMAFVRRDGNHQTSVCPKESWNESFMQGWTDAINEHWDVFENNMAKFTAQLRDALISDMRAILPLIKEQHPESVKVLPMTRLHELVEAQINAVSNVLRNNNTSYSQDLRNVAIDITQDSDKAYFSRAMQNTYDKCKADKGPGVTKRSLEKVETHLAKDQFDSPFTKAERALESALLKNDVKHINGGKDSVKKRVEAILQSTYEAFDRLDDRQVDDPKERKAMKALQKILRKLEETYRAVGEKLSEVKSRYPA